LGHQQWKYIEIRPVEVNFEQAGEGIDFARTASHSLHTLDLGAELTDLFGSLDKDSVQRRIHRARRAGLIEKSGRSEDLLNDFYTLFVLTRGRHRLPPNPVSWFRNLIDCEGDDLEIRVAYGHGIPMAAILTLRFRETLCYKYGCSDVRFNRFGAMPWLLWNALSASKSTGAKVFDLGRTEDGDAGLLRFKNNWAPGPRTLSYWRFPETYPSFDSAKGWKLSLAKRAFSHMPNGLLTITGRLLYRHIG
jgi:lipid II:glycine glycyltransferase (peptidoglycan interpeptide bridge formation enzyme)